MKRMNFDTTSFDNSQVPTDTQTYTKSGSVQKQDETQPDEKNETRTIKALPQEIIDTVYSLLPNTITKGKLRLTCRKMHCDSHEQLFSRVVVSPTAQSMGKVMGNFNRTLTNRHSQQVEVPSLAKTLVYEDVLPKPLMELRGLDLKTLHPSAKAAYHSYVQEFHRYRNSNQCLAYMMRAPSNMRNLERFEWHWGFTDAPEPGPDADISLKQLLSVDQSSQTPLVQHVYSGRIWADRGSARILGHPSGVDVLHGENARKQFHMAVNSALRVPHRTKPLTMVIKTGLENVLYAPLPQLQFPANELKGLEIWYQGSMSDLDDFEMDLSILSNTATGTAQQFRGLKWLTLAGGPIEERLFLNLEMLGDEDNYPEWPDLEVIYLENVQIGFATAAWLKGQRADLKVHNAIWIDGALEELNEDCVLKSVKCSGTQIVVDEDDNSDG